MTPALADFREQFPAPLFATATDAQVTKAIAEAGLLHDRNEIAWLYCAAHLLAIATEHTGKPDGGSGVVKTERIGPRQIGYETNAGADARRTFFATTSFGRRFLELEARTPRVGFGTVIG